MPKHPGDLWAERAIRNYLNKYAGTERDPLKDVEIPLTRFEGGRQGETARWEDLTDSMIGARPAHLYPEVKTPNRYEPVYDVEGIRIHDLNKETPTEESFMGFSPGTAGHNAPHAMQAQASIRSYLAHVGDYLRQNVPPEKLSQYDLVRAVKETAANDARVAKEMEKASLASMKGLPVHKDYGNGFKWVELKKPEKLTPEQMKGVRKAEFGQGIHVHDEVGMPGETRPMERGESAYVALDPSGKPIRNSYTNEHAIGSTPEEAYLAGQLAQEGNQMGHCVGGYCEGVASGDSRIFSLRDSKGRSHVTIETGPRGMPRSPEHYRPKGAPEEDIVQIKGKQNRAPNPEYLPYVQDFVKSGKWGEVGDLRNSGLHDITQLKGYAQDFPRAYMRLKAQNPERRFYTDDELKAAEGEQ